MPALSLRDACEADFERIVALNAVEAVQTSAMPRERLQLLHTLACHHRVAEADGRVVAFLLAMDHAAAYDSENFRWFAGRFPRFVYVDRIVVDATMAGRGIGAGLYRDLFAYAHGRGIDAIACEYNQLPPNPASKAFHDRFGFVEVGQQPVAGGSKLVSLQMAPSQQPTASLPELP